MSGERPTWDTARLAMARELAKRSLCTRDKVGAVITDADNRIVAEGYNGPPDGYVHGGHPCTSWCPRSARHEKGGLILPGQLKEDYSDCPSLHAEANALMMSDRTTRKGGTLYVTSFPCVGCRKLITNSGLARIVIGVDGKHEYRYRPGDYVIFALLKIAVVFEDNRGGPMIMDPAAASWFGVSQMDYYRKILENLGKDALAHQKDSDGKCVHGCDPSTTNCD